MIVFDHELDFGFILSLSELDERLRLISDGPHQWATHRITRPVLNQQGVLHTYIAVGYTNPETVDMPNFLCYLFPTLDNGSSVGFSRDLLVCLHPSAAIPIAEGLYFEDASLKGDILEDWGRFWDPLRTVLNPS